MKFFLQRLDKERVLQTMAGHLHVHGDGKTFSFYLDTPVKGIILTDGKVHDFDLLEGVITGWFLNPDAIHLRSFMQLDGQWHEEMLQFHFSRPAEN